MKKIVFLFAVFTALFGLTFVSAQVTDTIVSLAPSNRNVLLEVFTSIGCSHCSDGDRISNELATAHPGRVNVINIHEGGYASNTYTTEFGTALRLQSNLGGYPQGTVNRHLFSGTATAMNRTDWTGKANQILATTSPVNIAAKGTLDWATRTLNIRVQLYYTANQTVTSNSLNIAIVQDNVLGPQSGDFYNPTQIVGDLYNHNDMLRHLITEQWGDTISTIAQGTLVEKTYQYVIPDQFGSPNPIAAPLEDLRFIAFVCEGHQEVLTSVEIPIQMVEQPPFTVAHGAQTSSHSPFFTDNTNRYTRNQVIYPAAMLSELVGNDISAVTFYLQTPPDSALTCSFRVKVGTVNVSQFTNNSFVNTNSAPISYNGTVAVAADNTLTIHFDEPYTYNGGNMLLELFTTTPGVDPAATFYGITATNGSLYSNSPNTWNFANKTLEDFIPKTTFTCVWADTCSPQNLAVSEITGSSAFLTWEPAHSTVPSHYEVSYRVAGAADWTVAAASTTDEYLLLTGLQPQTNYEVRMHALCGGSFSDYLTAAFSTGCSGGYTSPTPIGDFTNPSTNSLPLYLGYRYCYTQQIFKADELNGAKRMDGIAIQYVNSLYNAPRNIDIYLGHTTKENFASDNSWIPLSSLSLVFSGTVTFNDSGEDFWFWIPFDTIFNYNGTDNLVVVFDDNTGTALSPSERFYNHYAYASSRYACSSSNIDPSSPTGSSNTSNYRANILMPGSCISDGCDRANVAVTDITVTSALLHFSAGNGSSGFELQYKRTADSTFTTLNATGNTYQLTGLKHNTEYTVRIRSLCAGSQSNWKETTFTTAVIYFPRVYASEGGTGNGGSWESAAGDLNYALSTAAAIHNTFGTWPDVWVAQGTYYGDSVSANAFTMIEGINVYGGFAGNETELSQRDVHAHPSILDGQHSQRVLNQPVIFTKNTVWDGFTIQNGHTTGDGGGARLRANTDLYNCTFLDNTGANGGGLYAFSATAYNHIFDCYFKGNVATADGGGLYGERVDAVRCAFTHNVANGNGGGICLYSSNSNTPHLSNCLIANNTAANGGGLWNYQGATYIENTTFVHNSASGNGAGIYDRGPIAQMVNCIIWGNRTTADAVSSIYQHVVSTSPKLLYNAVEGGLDGEGNITLTSTNTGGSLFSPRFVHPSNSVGASDSTANADWHLSYGSPCVNSGRESGSNFFTSAFDTVDLDNGPRILHDTIDMGCYESDYNTSPMPQYGNIIYVTEQGAGTQFGDSWGNASASIADAQALAQSHNAVVWVAKGTYYGNTTSDNAFDMVAGVSVYGGFEGNEPTDYDLSQRDFETNASILDGQNARRVLNQPSNFTEATAVTWDGFTIQHGRTSGYGAGVYLRQNVTLSHCIIQNNNVYYYSSTGSAVSSYGAGVFSYLTLSAGMRPNLISDCIIRNNSFENNSSLTGRGAGLCIKGTKLIRTEISHNTTPSYGGGIYSYADDTLSNCLIHSNSASFGGGIYINGGSNIYTNCDIVGNTVSSNGGGIYSNDNTLPEFTNCIIWGNRKSGNPNNSNPNIVCTYSAVEGGYDGVGNIALASENTGSDPLSPRFKHPSSSSGVSNNPDYSDWRLAFGSPCVNIGTNTGADTIDLDGNNRIQKGIIDMGCYESPYDSVPPQYGNIIYVTKHGAGGQIGNNWADALSSIEEAQALAREHNAVVWVAKGTYYGNTSSYNAFYMVPGVSVYGGFAGNEPADYNLSLRDFETNATILDGLNARRVLDQTTNFTADSAVTWDGFTIQNGRTSGYGAGVYMMQYSALSHCIVQHNNVYYYSSTGSNVSSYGAGVFSYITLSDGMRPNIISDCIIRYNSFEDHTSLTGRGAGLCIKGTKIIRTEISHNTCPRSYGGGIYSYADDTLSNCLVHSNNARYGAGMYIIGANNRFTNCDFVCNTVPSNGNGGGFYNNSSVSPVFTNCILWGNKKDNNVSDFVYSSGNPPTLTYCAVTGGFSGTGNLNLAIANDGDNDTLLYVRLVDPANGDFQLQPTSACIDAGNSGAVDSDRDFYSNPRLNGTVDIGCYEANSNITVSIEATACDSYTWNGITYTVSGNYVQTFPAANGSDSVVTLHLTVNYSTHNVETESACESFVWHGQTYSETGTYTYAYTNAGGCESVDTLKLTVSPVFSTPVQAEICDGDSYDFFGQSLTTAGSYTHTLQSISGCDSVIALTLTVNPVFNTPLTAEICEGGNYNFFDTTLTTAGTYTHTLQSVHGCDSVITLTLTVNPVYNTPVTAEICDGSSYDFFGQTLTTAGTYTHTLQSVHGCDSVIVLTLTVNPTFNTPVTAEICEGETYSFFGQTLAIAGTYTHTLQTIHGCDSVIALTLTVNPVFNTPLTADICDGGSYSFFDTTLTTAGTYTHTLQSVHGCDSVITLTLTVHQPVFGVDERAACDSLTWINGVTYYESTNAPTFALQAANGCDSIVTLHLTIANILYTDVYESGCDQFTWEGTTYSTSGEYTKTFTTVSGCDSVVTLHLTIHPTYQTSETASICEGNSYVFFDTTLTTAGTYTHTLPSSYGCDSVINLTLTVNPVYNFEYDLDICEGEILYFNNDTITESGSYTQTLQTVNGCDSIVTIVLTVHSIDTTQIAAEICDGGSYNFFGQTLTMAGTYTHTLQSVIGCDSVITLTLTVNPVYNTSTTATICEGDSYNFFGQTLTTAGTYTHTLQSANGCDSMITLTLTVNPVYNTPVSAEICEGGSYDFFGQILTTSGTYTHTMQSVSGCDSVIILTLTEVSAYNTPVAATICDGNSYDFFGQTLTSAGTYTHTLQSVNGCDSVITLTLTVSQGTHNVETETACESFTWHGETYTTSGVYTYAYNNASGCASVDTLFLTVNHGTHNVETETACENFTWHGETYTTSGVYTYAYNNGDGCESIDTLHLTVNYSATSDFSITTEDPCYEWNNVSYCETGDYIQTLQTVDGCDSVVTLHLTITVGIDDHDLSGIEVFPNPTNHILNIKGEEMRHIDIFNADGQLIYTKENDGADLLQVDVTDFAAGQYFVKVRLGDGRTATRKVVVSRR